jgi:excisionase family DNA binding protein
MEVLTVAEIAELFGVAPTTVRRWIRDGWLPALRVKGHLRVARAHVVRQFFTLMTDPHASTRRERKRMHDMFQPAVIELDDLADAALKRAEAPALRRAHRRGWRIVGDEE